MIAHEATAMIWLLVDPQLFKAIIQLLAAWTHNLLDGLLQCGLNFFPAFFFEKVTAEKHSITNSIYKEVGQVN